MTDVTPEAAPETPATGTTEAPETQAPDITQQLSERFDQLSGQMEQLTQGWNQFQEAAYEPEQDPYSQDPYAQQQDPYQQQQPQVDLSDPQQLAQFIDQRAQAIADQRTGPIQQQITAQQLQQLASKYEVLQDPEGLKAIDGVTGRIAQQFGNPQLATDPFIVELAVKAHLSDKFASQQQPIGDVQGQQAHLEGAGATPQQPADDPMDKYFPADQGPSNNVFGL
jgi:hypothetical protein